MNLNIYRNYKKLYKRILFSKKDILAETTQLTTVIRKEILNENYLIDHTGMDLINKVKLIYLLNGRNQRFYIIYTPNHEIAPSLQHLAKATYVTEREIYEFFGIFFTQALDLRRLLTDYQLVGNPLKKAFPLVGFLETRYSIKKLLYQKELSLPQEFRDFSNYNLWSN